MSTSPFKFLDSYTRDDRHIFFGRDREIEELYHRVFESKIMLVYGVSGTGKSSLINCGLANKFQDTDWLPISVRRAGDIIQSMAFAIQQAAITPVETENLNPKFFKKAVKSLYLDHYKPVFFIFDQVEELFIFGNRQEQKEFFQLVKSLMDSDLSCRFIFVLRKEYLADVSEFERLIPTLMANRVNIERMTLSNATQAIEGPCKVSNIQLEEGFSEALLEKLSPGSTEVELTYLQVFLDKLYHMAATDNKAGTINFSKNLLEKTGNVSDLLGSFLDDQISLLEDPDTALAVLKSFVSVKGTKRQMSPGEIQDYAQTLGKPVEGNALQELIQTFIHLRILREKDQNNRYELRHDALAEKIYEKITLVEKELLEIRQLIENAYHNWQKRGVLISADDLDYIAPFESRLYLSKDFEALVEKSKFSLVKAKRRRRNIAFAAVVILLLVFGGFTIWALKERKVAELQKEKAVAANKNAVKAEESALQERNRAIENEKAANLAKEEAEIAKSNAINAKQIAENELYQNIKNSLSVSPEKMNVLYFGVENPVSISVSGIPSDKLTITADHCKIEYRNGMYYILPLEISTVTIMVYGKIKSIKKELIGSKTFRVKGLPDPYVSFAGMKGGSILKEILLETKKIDIKMDIDYDMNFVCKEFSLSALIDGYEESEASSGDLISKRQYNLLGKLRHGQKLYIDYIKAVGPDGNIRPMNNLFFRILDPKSAIESKNDTTMHIAAVDFYDDIRGFHYDNNTSKVHIEKYLSYSLEIFNAMMNRKPDDLFDELKALRSYYQFNPSSEIKSRISENFKAIINYNWQPLDIDLFYRLDFGLSFFNFDSTVQNFVEAPILEFDSINQKLGYPEFVVKLGEKLLGYPEITEDQKVRLINYFTRLSEQLYQYKEYDRSLQLCLSLLKIENRDVCLKTLLISNYEAINKEKPSRELQDKIDSVFKELLTEGDINGLSQLASYFCQNGLRSFDIELAGINYQKCLIIYEKMVKEFPSERRNLAFTLYNSACFFQSNGAFYYALQTILLSIAADENFELSLCRLPLLYLINNQYPEAEKYYRKLKDKPWTADNRFKTFAGAFLRDIESYERGITWPEYNKIKLIISGAEDMPSEQGNPDIFINGKLGNGFNMGVASSGGKKDWLNNAGTTLCLHYPEEQSWGVFWITLNGPLESQNLKRNYAPYSKLYLELKGEKGGEAVLISIMDMLDPLDGSESKAQLSLSNEWKSYEIDIAKNFSTAYLPKLHMVTQLVFGTEPQIIYARKIQFLK